MMACMGRRAGQRAPYRRHRSPYTAALKPASDGNLKLKSCRKRIPFATPEK